MRTTWLIEAGVYGADADPLVAEVRRQGAAAAVVPYRGVRTGSTPDVDGRPLEPDARVIAYGTYPFARQILLHQPWRPGAWCDADALDCAAYYPHFAAHLLNRSHALLPGVDAIRDADRLFAEYAVAGRVFARPASLHKLFVGRLVARADFATALAPTRYDPTARVVIAAPRPLGREWRLVVVAGRVVAGSQYAVAGEKAVAPDCPAEVRRYAEDVLAAVPYRPDPAFMLDVAESAGGLVVVELNSFSASWLYACDVAAVVAAVNTAVQDDPSEPRA